MQTNFYLVLIRYNSLNLPDKLVISDAMGTATNTYLYSANGRKLNVTSRWGTSSSKNTDYVGNMIYENGALKRILVNGGYLEGGIYYFYLTDHLGNNRVVAKADGTVVQSNHYYPFGMNFAEGITTSSQPYKFGNKELDTDRGLNWYDFLARHKDGFRFMSIDPLCEKYYWISPYVYCMNNPVNRIAPKGLTDYLVNEDGYIYEKNPLFEWAKRWIGIEDEQDKLIATNGESLSMGVGMIKNKEYKKGDKVLGHYFNISDDDAAERVYIFLSENTKVEWGRIKYGNKRDADNIISTSHKIADERLIIPLVMDVLNKKLEIEEITHSHYNGGPPSGYLKGQMRNDDKLFVDFLNLNFPSNKIVHRVYDVPNKKYIYYNSIETYERSDEK